MRYVLSAWKPNGVLTRIEQRAFLMQRRETYFTIHASLNDRFWHYSEPNGIALGRAKLVCC